MISARELTDHMETHEHVYRANRTSRRSVVIVETSESSNSVKTFNVVHSRGWTVGTFIPNETGNIITFVPIEDVGPHPDNMKADKSEVEEE